MATPLEFDELPDGFVHEPGWNGAFTRAQAPGAIPNGSRVMKSADEPNDGHTIGDMGVVLGSVAVPEEARANLVSMGLLTHPGSMYLYFIEWDDTPRTAIGIVSAKITAMT